MDHRQNALQQWLAQVCPEEGLTLKKLQGDASFRRYFRIQYKHQHWIAMDAPLESENCVSYIAVSNALRALGLNTPEIAYANLRDGFLLITDFGDQTLLKTLNLANADMLYRKVLDVLKVLQSCRQIVGWQLPTFSRDFIHQELLLFEEWFLNRYCQLALSSIEKKMLESCYQHLSTSAAEQPQVFMHRDFHSANLMVLSNQEIGILDFQDAFIGPVTYDLVSLLRDCYIDWPESHIESLISYYHNLLELQVDKAIFLRWFDWMGMQRHLKALLTFSRKYLRDHNSNYLQYLPRTLGYVERVSKCYPELKEFHLFLNHRILPAVREKIPCVE